MISITVRKSEIAPGFQSLAIRAAGWATVVCAPSAVAAELAARIEAAELDQTGITPEQAAHVLWHFGATGGMEPDPFTRHLVDALAVADRTDQLRLAAVYPAYALAARQAATEDGVQRLQEIALTAPVRVGGEHRG